MDKNLQKSLLKKYKKLYKYNEKTETSSLLFNQFVVGDGWYHLLYVLSKELEQELDKIENHISITIPFLYLKKSIWNSIRIKELVLFKSFKYFTINSNNENTSLISFINFISSIFNVKNLSAKYVTKDECIKGINVLQVKSKFGGLRFYMNCNSKMNKIIDSYTRISYKICEECGDDGVYFKHHGWIYTVCEKHQNKIWQEYNKNN
jgi:hypothetical protein